MGFLLARPVERREKTWAICRDMLKLILLGFPTPALSVTTHSGQEILLMVTSPDIIRINQFQTAVKFMKVHKNVFVNK